MTSPFAQIYLSHLAIAFEPNNTSSLLSTPVLWRQTRDISPLLSETLWMNSDTHKPHQATNIKMQVLAQMVGMNHDQRMTMFQMTSRYVDERLCT